MLYKPIRLTRLADSPRCIYHTAFHDGFYDRLRGNKLLLTVNNTEHLSYCDALLLVALCDYVTNEQWPVVEAVLGTIDGRESAGILDGLLFSIAQVPFSGGTEGSCGRDHTSEHLRNR